MSKQSLSVEEKSDVQRLHQLLADLGSAVNRQQRYLVAVPDTGVRSAALRDNGELTRLLVYLRRSVEMLEKQQREQLKEREGLRAVQHVGAAINSSLDLSQVLKVVMDAIIELTKAERALLLLTDEVSGELEVEVARNVDRETINESESFAISRSIVQQVAASGEPVVTTNALEDERFAAQQSIIDFHLRSILCVPLRIRDKTIGVIYTDNRIAAGIFDDKDRDLLDSFADQAAVAIENARLFQQTQAHLAEITEMKRLMDNVFASIDSGVITIDDQDRITLFNRAARRLLSFAEDSTISDMYQIALRALGKSVEELVDRVRSDGSTQNAELEIPLAIRPGVTTLNLTVSPLRQDRLGAAMVLDDVSEKKRMESVRRYLPPALVDRVRDLDEVQKPQRRSISVMFADVRGFSTYSERLDPEELIEIINGYFTEAVNAITRYEGVTDKFMGDAVMALFNTPLNPQEDHVIRAVRTAKLIQARTAEHLLTLRPEHQMQFGLGIHTGEAVVGNVGSHLRKDYSAIGDAVNIAKRLQEMATPGQILLSQSVYEQVGELIHTSQLEPVQLKGRTGEVRIHELVIAA